MIRWQGALNWYLLQWLGLRLFRTVPTLTHKTYWYIRMVRPLSGYNGTPFKTWKGKPLP